MRIKDTMNTREASNFPKGHNGYAPYPPLPSRAAPHSDSQRSSPSTQSLDLLGRRLREQIEYYFSDQNLAGDWYLRDQMDPQGFVDVSKITEFSRVKALLNDLVNEVLHTSELVEVRDGKMRKKQGWELWKDADVDN